MTPSLLMRAEKAWRACIRRTGKSPGGLLLNPADLRKYEDETDIFAPLRTPYRSVWDPIGPRHQLRINYFKGLLVNTDVRVPLGHVALLKHAA